MKYHVVLPNGSILERYIIDSALETARKCSVACIGNVLIRDGSSLNYKILRAFSSGKEHSLLPCEPCNGIGSMPLAWAKNFSGTVPGYTCPECSGTKVKVGPPLEAYG